MGDISCTFQNSYDIQDQPTYDVTELTQTVEYGTFILQSNDFSLELNAATFDANQQLIATFGTKEGAINVWGKVNTKVGFSPQKCTVKDNGNNAEFVLLDAENNLACGYTEIDTALTSTDNGEGAARDWVLKYQTFVMAVDSHTGSYTLICKLSMCTPSNRENAAHVCALAHACA